ncbi:hypothetical protein H257_19568 [Aphanomyces astaci]|uniref:Uncharacterized protein n=1 Tax=Aphanomyces astaci TaxID=112090 RepID=W4F9B6_APHAT|nr:hypothetical protein H257_19568 [Aphanomyces astaci]ETV63509.1 hypothetical protein H257_19568 [Aphanomyces astaci]|eukprot:XP_009847008.1 hypothetical protein H257_19568 [Aphanomyces astaci]
MTKELNPSCPTWRDTSLPQRPKSRRMAKAWITQRMLHSTDAMFQQHGFPAWDAPQEVMDVCHTSTVRPLPEKNKLFA